MGRPSKTRENLAKHLTNEEKKLRDEAQKLLLTGLPLKERPEVKKNAAAHREFKRVNKLLQAVGKNDALYERVINEYCSLQAECGELEEMKEKILKASGAIEEQFAAGELDGKEYFKLLDRAQGRISEIEKQKDNKRKRLLDIEKECAMTISAAMRSIPKTVNKEKNPIFDLL